MKRVCLLVMAAGLAGAGWATDSESIRLTVTRTLDWQLRNRSTTALRDWTQAALYAGIMTADDMTDAPRYREAMREVGLTVNWQPGTRTYHADDHAVAQAYLALALKEGHPEWAAPALARLDFILANPSTQGVAAQYTSTVPGVVDKVMRWWWCDALFMAPPVWLRAWQLTGDARYRDFVVQEWLATDALLYREEHGFYYRDQSRIGTVGPNGLPVFWGRGNGWVAGGLVEVLKILPDDDPARPWFEGRLQAMAAALAACQQADGSWRMDLLNADADATGETSGTAFFCYLLAYGVNAGLLDSAAYGPVVANAWTALRAVILEDGKLTHVQPAGAAPAAFDVSNTAVYGVGGFAFAGAERYRGALRAEYPHAVIAVTNAAAHGIVDVFHPLGSLALPPPLRVQDDASGRWLAASALDTDGDGAADALRFQDVFLAGQAKRYRVFGGVPSDNDGRFTRDLVAWWRMDDAGGGRVTDGVGFHSASVSGAVSFVEGKVDGAAALTGGYASDAALWASALPSRLTACTVAGWIKPSATYSGQFPRLLACDRFALMLRDNSPNSGVLDLALYNTAGANYREWAYSNTVAAAKIAPGVWYHAAVTFDFSNPANAPRFYLDGQQKAAMKLVEAGGTLVAAFGRTVIGNRSLRDRSFAGAIDDLRVYARELSGTEIAELYRATAPAAPTVDAGPDRTVDGSAARLTGRLAASGTRLAGETPEWNWEAVAFPGGAEPAIDAPGAFETEVALPAPGVYTFRLTAANAAGSGSDEVTLTARAAVPKAGNQPPSVALADGTRALAGACGLRLNAVAADADGDACSVAWSLAAGPAPVRFAPPASAETVAWFDTPGLYTVRVTVGDGHAEASAEAEIRVGTTPAPVRWFPLNDGSTSVAADLARGHDATALYHKGTNDSVRAGLSFRPANARVEFDWPVLETVTVTAWVWHDANAAATYPRILATSGSEINWEGYWGVECISLNVHQESGAEDEWLTPSNSFPRSAWVHVAMVHDRRGRVDPVLYINGAAQALTRLKAAGASLARLPPGSRAFIGNRLELDRRWQGTIADFRIYDALLDAGQIADVMNDAPSATDVVFAAGNRPPEIAVDRVPAVVPLAHPLALRAAVSDDGERWGRLTCRWRKVSGSGNVQFTWADDLAPEAVFSRSGDYVLELAVSDGEGTRLANVKVTVRDFSGTTFILR
jgi:rhamnogalacturonyl hydrolase YesR/PKD repeat protein